MSFLTQWKTAKEKFESATKDKKPGDKFWVVFRKGSDIEGSLKSLNSAKTKAEVLKAVSEFDSAASTYCERLTKEASNPSTVPKVDKKVYETAIKNLKKSLDDIKEEAQNMAGMLDEAGGNGESGKVNSKAVQAAEHLMIPQRKLVAKLTPGFAILEKLDPEIEQYRKGSNNTFKTATDPKNAGMAGKEAYNALMRLYDTLRDTRIKKAKPHYEAAKEITSELQQSAANLKDVKSAKPPLAASLLKEADELSKTLTKIAKVSAEIEARMIKADEEVLALTKEAIPVDLGQLDDDTAHVKLREKLIGETDKWAKEAQKELGEIQQLESNVKKLLAGAEKFKNKKEAVSKIEVEAQKALVTSAKLVKKVNDEESNRTKNTGELMTARGDGGVGDKLPPKVGKPLRERSNKAFEKFDANQRVWLAAVAKINASGTTIASMVEKIEALNGTIRPAKEYTDRFTPILKQLTDTGVILDTRNSKLEGAVNRAPEMVEGVLNGAPAANTLKTLTGLQELARQMIGNTEAARNYAATALERANATLSQDEKVVELVKQVKEKAQANLQLCAKFAKLYPPADKAYKKAVADIEKIAKKQEKEKK